GTPAEVFAQAERLRAIGLTVPEVTSLFLRLRELGLPVDPATYTLEDALRQLSALRKGGRPC
ncbi:MAG: energy-coupling factor transporter ATPase, partial [Candidatus Ventricola sp.]|nr:energy-coupling factor transporter ATPase [Candidatus Ventricola sp.]